MKLGEQIVTQLDADIAETEQRLAQLRTVRAGLAALYGDTTPAVARGERRTTPTPSAAAPRSAGAATDDPDGARVLRFLEKQKAPVSIGTVVDGTGRSAYLVKKALDGLVEATSIVRVGAGRACRVGVPAVMAAAAKEAL